MRYSYVMWFWVLLIILAIWWFSKNRQTNHVSIRPLFEEKREISEEMVFDAQTRFEKELEVDLPGDINRKDRYIYRHLMWQWFSELSAKNRYDEKMTQKLRSDFLEWMFSVEQGASCNYLSFELEGEDERESYSDEAMKYGRKAMAVEDGFAAAVGDEAKKELERVRKMDFNSFSRIGELAPDGMKYDLLGNLKKKGAKE